MQLLIYEIAGYRLLIETPNAETTRLSLPSLSVFEKPRSEAAVLFRLAGEQPLSLPLSATRIDTLAFDDTSTELFKTKDGYFVVSKAGNKRGIMRISDDMKTVETDISLTDSHSGILLYYFITMAFNMSILSRRGVKIHASVIEKNGDALLFLGKSGTGKSTHSRLWQKYVEGCTLLNDDSPIIRLHDNGEVYVYGSPWSGKTPCYRNVRATVKAFVHLYQSKENRLTKLPAMEGIASLLFSSSTFKSDSENKSKVFDTLTLMLDRVPVYRLDCRPDEAAVRLTESLLDK